MADNQSPLQHPIPEEQEEQDVLFKAQMWVYDLFIKNWKLLAYIAGAVLLGAFIYGATQSWSTRQAKKGAALIAEVDRKMPEIDQMAMMGLVPMDNLSDPDRVATLKAGAEGYEAAAKGSSGAASAHAWLKAAETWLRLNEREKAKGAFSAALDADDSGILGYSAHAGLAALAVGEGKADEAEAQYRAAAADPGYLGESALLLLVELKMGANDSANAQKALDEARTRYPTSPRVEEAAKKFGLVLAATAAPAAAADPAATAEKSGG